MRASANIQGVQYFTNGLDTRTQGLDVTAGYKVPAGANGTLELSAGFNVTRNKIIHVDPLPQVLVDAGSTEPGLLDSVTAIGIEDERPDWRGTLQANYTVGRFTSLGRFSYYGGFSSAQPGFCDLCRENYGGKGLTDAEVGYRFNLIKLSVGVRNLFESIPTSRARRSWSTNSGTRRRTSTITSGRSPGPRPRRSDTTAGSSTRGRSCSCSVAVWRWRYGGMGRYRRRRYGWEGAPSPFTVPAYRLPAFFETPYQSWRPLPGPLRFATLTKIAMSASYDLIIIGGGHNGLVTAAYLARAGLRVCVLERREVLGGACVTEEVWPGYKVSTAAYVNSLLRPEIIRDLELKRHGFEMLPRNPSSFTPFPGRALAAARARQGDDAPRDRQVLPEGRRRAPEVRGDARASGRLPRADADHDAAQSVVAPALQPAAARQARSRLRQARQGRRRRRSRF